MAYDQVLIAIAALLGLVVIAVAALKGWRDWLALKNRELDRAHPGEGSGSFGPGPGTARIEIADLKERVRKLEAIAAGVDL